VEGGPGGFIRDKGATKGLPGDESGNLERARNLGERHVLDFAVAEVFEEAKDGGEEFLTGDPFLFPKFAGAARPIGGLLEVAGGLGLGLSLEQAGVEGVQAVAPAVFAGPIFDGGGIFAEGAGNGPEGATVTELEESQESAEGARGFAGLAGENWLRVEG
jgi:hypothetical protein